MSIFNDIDVHMNKILSLIKQRNEYSLQASSPHLNFFENKSTNGILEMSKNNNESDLITSRNFLSTHQCNRDVDYLSLNSQTNLYLDTRSSNITTKYERFRSSSLMLYINHDRFNWSIFNT